MKAVDNETLIKQLKWRYATKKFDPTRKVPPEDWRTLEQAVVLAPSSFGLQPWRFVVVTNPDVRQKLRAASWNQSQITDASHLVVFAARKGMGPADVDKFVKRVAHVRGVNEQDLAGYRQVMVGFVSPPRSQAEIDAWAARQVYVALGTLLTSAAMLGIDSCPMEGIEPAKYDEILGLSTKGFGALAVAAIGYRAPDDPYAKLAKVRFDPAEVIEHVE